MNNENDIEVTSYVESNESSPQLPMQLSPLQEQLLETAAEMGLDVVWYKENILTDPICLNGLEVVTE